MNNNRMSYSELMQRLNDAAVEAKNSAIELCVAMVNKANSNSDGEFRLENNKRRKSDRKRNRRARWS